MTRDQAAAPPDGPRQEVATDWYDRFFTHLPNEFWRRAVTDGATQEDVDFIEQRLELQAGSRVLDVPCGSGRHTLALASRGHRVVGYDVSAEAIEHARRTATTASLDVEFVQGEMRSVPADGSFDAAICMGNSFGYLDLAGTRRFLAALAASIRPGGGLVIDHSATAESVLPGFVDGQPRDLTIGDITAAGSNTYDVHNSRLVSHYVFTRGDQRFEATALHHVHTVAQIADLLAGAGFTDLTLYGGPAGQPFDIGAPRLMITARRV